MDRSRLPRHTLLDKDSTEYLTLVVSYCAEACLESTLLERVQGKLEAPYTDNDHESSTEAIVLGGFHHVYRRGCLPAARRHHNIHQVDNDYRSGWRIRVGYPEHLDQAERLRLGNLHEDRRHHRCLR